MAQLMPLARAAASQGSARDRAAVRWLVEGGDERIDLDPETGLNPYGCGAWPDDAVAAFGSTTASVISRGAFARVARTVAELGAAPPGLDAYEAQTRDIRRRLALLCGLAATAEPDIVLTASGTDAHLIAADLARGGQRAPLVTVLADPAETGRGVPDAVRCQSFAARSPHGGAGEPGRVVAGGVAGRIAAIPVREADGAVRSAAAIDEDFARACRAAIRAGGPVLLTLVDLSKTGLMAPSLACATGLKQQFGDALTVLVDACQFRIGEATLAAYLSAGFLVAVTGSKFLTGPAFSGAVFVPEALTAQLHDHGPARGIGDHSGRRDWPRACRGRALLPDLANLGMVLRWQAALHELEAFRALEPDRVAAFARRFCDNVQAALDAEDDFERLACPALTRVSPLAWDAVPTIFPFLIRQGARLIDADQTRVLHRRLQAMPSPAIHLGQPVGVGAREGRPVSALRLSLSARLVAEALRSPRDEAAVIDRALGALETTAALAGAV